MAITHNDFVAFLISARLTATDEAALIGKELYPVWAENISVLVNDRYQYGDKLYKCVQAHTTQANWTPDLTPAMWTVIDVEHAGTIDDPIPASRGMEYVKGKYYIENDVIYLMNRQGMQDGESIVLQYMPSELIGQYFEIVG